MAPLPIAWFGLPELLSVSCNRSNSVGVKFVVAVLSPVPTVGAGRDMVNAAAGRINPPELVSAFVIPTPTFPLLSMRITSLEVVSPV